MTPPTQKTILVIGATGAQGRAVVAALLAPAADGSTPYCVRALTRDPDSPRAKALAEQGAELAKGAFDDLPSVAKALDGAYGAWVNTDGFTVGDMKETHLGIKIFELARRTPSLRHYVWSSLDYSTKKGGFNPDYKCDHYDGKGRVTDFLKSQTSVAGADTLSWSVVTLSPYMDMLEHVMFAPLNKRKNGTAVFASPIGDGHVPMIALKDVGWWARYTFEHRAETSGRDLEVTGERVGWDHLVATYTRVTGKPAVHVRQTLDEWWDNFIGEDRPVANEREAGDGSTTVRENFSGWWRQWRDDLITRNMVWIRKTHPETQTVEEWMREHKYNGEIDPGVLKNVEDGKSFRVNTEKTGSL